MILNNNCICRFGWMLNNLKWSLFQYCLRYQKLRFFPQRFYADKSGDPFLIYQLKHSLFIILISDESLISESFKTYSYTISEMMLLALTISAVLLKQCRLFKFLLPDFYLENEVATTKVNNRNGVFDFIQSCFFLCNGQ